MSENQLPGTDGFIVESAAMKAPSKKRLIERRPYVTRRDAPATHARLQDGPDENTYALTFNGVDLVTLRFPEGCEPYLRYHSDGDFQSTPFIQQFVMSVDSDCEVEVEFAAPVEMWNMRPRRAEAGEAILGQLGAPLLYGVNGMYLPDWDMLLSWHGMPFIWRDARVTRDGNCFRARMTVSASLVPCVLLFRPRYYSEHLGYAQYRPWDRRPNDKPVAGWCSWEAYHSDVTQAHVEEAARVLASLRPYGLEYMQLDDGYQQERVPMRPGAPVGESWLNTNEKFPGGHEAIVNAMRDGGFLPGIWTNATLTDLEAAEATGACLRGPDGALIRGDWIQYVIDCELETLAEHVTPYYRAFRELGYEYYKSDSIRHLLYDGLQEAVRLGVMEPDRAREKLAAYLRAARAGIGENSYYLSCWGVLSQSIGICDAMRVSTDAGPRWASVSMQLRETARWFFAQRILFTLDPDHVCVRAELLWVRMLLSLVSLTGGLYMVSDKPESYDPSRIELIRKTLPTLRTHAGETGPVDYTTPACARAPGLGLDDASRAISHLEDDRAPFSSLWCVHFEADGRQWSVVQRCAVIPLAKARIPLESLALDPAKKYMALNFWTQEVRPVEDALDFSALALGDTEVCSLVDVSDGKPRLLGSDRHVSMDAVGVRRAAFREDGVFELLLIGFYGLKCTYTLYAPGLDNVQVSNNLASVQCERSGDILRVIVEYAGEMASILLS